MRYYVTEETEHGIEDNESERLPTLGPERYDISNIFGEQA